MWTINGRIHSSTKLHETSMNDGVCHWKWWSIIINSEEFHFGTRLNIEASRLKGSTGALLISVKQCRRNLLDRFILSLLQGTVKSKSINNIFSYMLSWQATVHLVVVYVFSNRGSCPRNCRYYTYIYRCDMRRVYLQVMLTLTGFPSLWIACLCQPPMRQAMSWNEIVGMFNLC